MSLPNPMFTSTLTAKADYRVIDHSDYMEWVVVLRFGLMEVGEIRLNWKLERAPNSTEVDNAVANFLAEGLFR